ncbi:MAG: hypothetical protein WB952_23680 [Terriglobales bacterium]
MKNLRMSWKLVALFVLGAIGSCFYVTRSSAFTLIESQYLPAVQLVESQSAAVEVSNISSEAVEVEVKIISDSGRVLRKAGATVGAGRTFTVNYTQPAAVPPSSIRARVELGTAQAAVSSLLTFDKTTGQTIISIQPGILLPAVQ